MEKIRKDMVLYRMIGGFAMLSAALILLLTTVTFALFGSQLKAGIYDAQVRSLEQISNSVSFRAEYVNTLILDAKTDKQIAKLFFSRNLEEINAAQGKLMQMRATVRNLNSIYVINEYGRQIYYSGANGLPFLNEMDEFEDKGFLEILENIRDYPKYTPILRKLQLEYPAGKNYETWVYTYLLYDSYSSGAIHNVVALNFHLGWMEDALDFVTAKQQVSDDFCIIQKNRQILYSEDAAQIGQYCSTDMLPDDIFSGDSGYVITGRGNDRKMIIYSTPSQRGYEDWTFVSKLDYSNLLRPLERIRRIIYLICFAVFAASLVVTIWNSRILYEPFRSAANRVKLLEAENSKKRKVEGRVFLRKLFLGDTSEDLEYLKGQFAQHQLDFDQDQDVQVLLVSVDNYHSFSKEHNAHMDEAYDAMEQVMRQVLTAAYPELLCVKMHHGVWALAIPSMGNETFDGVLFEKINALLGEKLNITVSMAISSTGHSVRDLPYLYSEAVNIHDYRFLRGTNSLICYRDIDIVGQNRYEHPTEIQKKLLNHLFAGKYTETVQDYEAFDDAIRIFTVDEIRLSCLLLAYAVKAGVQSSVADSSGMLVEFDGFFKRIQTAETFREVDQLFDKIFREITERVQNNSKERYEALIGQIEEYVMQHYGDLNLSMNQISDQVDMSAAYLGRLYKQVTGITFIEYLTKFRLKRACELLTTTDMTVNDISDHVGFTNSSYFYIIFKKSLGCTPNQYRKQSCAVAEEE